MPIKSSSRPLSPKNNQPSFTVSNLRNRSVSSLISPRKRRRTKRSKTGATPVEPDLTVSIVNYNTRDQLYRCLTSLFKFTKDLRLEVYVVDNHSHDQSPDMVRKNFPWVKLIKNSTNRYYSQAHNQVLAQAKGRYFLILNPDVYLQDNSLKKLAAYLDTHPKVAAVEPLQLDQSNHLIPTGTKHAHPLVDLINLTLLHRFLKGLDIVKITKQHSKNRSHTWFTDVISGAAILTRTRLLQKLGGFDPDLKLYYTDNELCLRLQKQGFTNVHLGSARVGHAISASTNQLSWHQINRFYADDAQTYYTKHYNPPVGTFLGQALRLNHFLIHHRSQISLYLLFAGVLAVASFLRFDRLAQLMPFIGDQGRDFLAARDLAITGHFPLLGIESSVPRFRQGPLYIWLLAPVLSLSGFDPAAAGYLAATLGLLAVGATFIIADRYFSLKTAALASFLIATSALSVAHSRFAFHVNAIPLFSALYLLSLLLFIKERRSLFWPALFFALLFQFELVTAPLIALIPLAFYLKNTRPRLSHAAPLMAGLGLGLSPQILYDLQHNFSQLGLFLIWIGYRVSSFAGLSPEHAASLDKIGLVMGSVFQYTQKFFSWFSPLPTLALVITSTLTLLLNRSLLHRPETKLLVTWVALMLLSFFILGNASEAYFPALFVPASLLLGLVLSSFTGRLSSLSLSLAALLFFANAYFLVSHSYLISTGTPHQDNPFNTYGPPLSDQTATTTRILNLNSPVRLASTDPGSHFASYLDNYRYLIISGGGTLDDQAGLPIWIYHARSQALPLDSRVFHYGAVTITLPLTYNP